MKNEMEILNMNKVEKSAWLLANRLTLILVGIIWVGIVIRELLMGSTPWFMIAMIFAFAFFRFIMYRYYKGKILSKDNFTGENS